MLKRLSVLVVMISAVFGTVLIATPASAAPVCQREIEPPPDCPPQEYPPPPSDPMMDPFLTVSGPGSVAIFGNGTSSVLFRTELIPRYCIWSACQTYSHAGFGSINSSGANVDFDLVRLS